MGQAPAAPVPLLSAATAAAYNSRTANVSTTAVNPHLALLHPYPFEKLRQLFAGVTPNSAYSPISLGIGEPKHPTPAFIQRALTHSLQGLASYPSTLGTEPLRAAIAHWLQRRYGVPPLDPATQVLPVNGSREALFGIAHCVIDATRVEGGKPLVISPNPFYQIYEGAAYLAGAEPYFVNSEPARNFACDYASVPAAVWERTQLLYLCSPGNPTGATVSLEDWKLLFALADRHQFIIAADECYSEIYHTSEAPLGALEAAHKLGRAGGDHPYRNLVVFSSLSKRSNVPGMRSGFVAGDAEVLKKFLLYRTYSGGAMAPPIQAASVAAWGDEEHVLENRNKYREKFHLVTPLLRSVLDVELPDAGFYLWADVRRSGLSDTEFARRLYADYNVTVLPGSYLARTAHGVNPGQDRVRMALVAEIDEGLEAAQRIVQFCTTLRAVKP
ncbi:MAG: succinyldiaminopimelate transaminase [Massilia sp.]|jgi:N-succinyldiaminopimelate aminotransferase|nr:succinyldiaminopimelate transaminase [Massilia sp.]